MKKDIASLRVEYSKRSLDVKDVLHDPTEQFLTWFNEAIDTQVIEPNAFTLSTINKKGRPSSRILLLKGVENNGFVFYTNYNSHKGQELINQGYGSLNFFWAELERQVRIEGSIEKVSSQESDAYFQIRPRGSQIGAWVSPQSEVIDSRDVLEARLAHYEKEFEGNPVPRPPHWGGFICKPDLVEFWQGRPSRLHDRILFLKEGYNDWKIQRLAP
jgi:pyridoxamine 5'-phosphate oxidase